MLGYKAFNSDLTCRDFQYEIGKTYEMDSKPVCCVKGFHFCKDLKECFRYYDFGARICEVETLGALDTNYGEKFCTNKIKIIRELSFEEICDIIGIEIIIGKNLIKSFELTKEFYNKKGALLSDYWATGAVAGPFCWFLIIDSSYLLRYIGARLSKDFKKIEFFRSDDFDRVLFECNDKGIYQVANLEDEDLEWFKYLQGNL